MKSNFFLFLLFSLLSQCESIHKIKESDDIEQNQHNIIKNLNLMTRKKLSTLKDIIKSNISIYDFFPRHILQDKISIFNNFFLNSSLFNPNLKIKSNKKQNKVNSLLNRMLQFSTANSNNEENVEEKKIEEKDQEKMREVNNDINNDEKKEEKKEGNREKKKDEKNENKEENKVENKENKEERKEERKEENKENQEENKEERREEKKEENKDESNVESKEERKEENKENQEERKEENKKENKDESNVESKEERKEENKEENKENQEERKEENKEENKDESNVESKEERKEENQEENKVEDKDENNKKKEEKKTGDSSTNESQAGNDGGDGDEPPEGPLDDDFESAIANNPFELPKYLRDRQHGSKGDDSLSKEEQDEKCNREKPNTMMGSRGACVCKYGFIGDDPVTSRGCWRCASEGNETNFRGSFCHHQAKCVYPGRCLCEGGMVGDGVDNCGSPIPRISRVEAHRNMFVTFNSSIEKAVIYPTFSGVKLFYQAPFDFVPFFSFCKFRHLNENDRDDMNLNENQKGENESLKVTFNRLYKPFNFVIGAVNEDKSVSCLLPPNFLNGDSKFKVALSFDGLNWTDFSDFELKNDFPENVERLEKLLPQRTPQIRQSRKPKETEKNKKKSGGLRIVINKNILLTSFVMLLLAFVAYLLANLNERNKKIDDENMPFLSQTDKTQNKGKIREGMRKRGML